LNVSTIPKLTKLLVGETETDPVVIRSWLSTSL